MNGASFPKTIRLVRIKIRQIQDIGQRHLQVCNTLHWLCEDRAVNFEITILPEDNFARILFAGHCYYRNV